MAGKVWNKQIQTWEIQYPKHTVVKNTSEKFNVTICCEEITFQTENASGTEKDKTSTSKPFRRTLKPKHHADLLTCWSITPTPCCVKTTCLRTADDRYVWCSASAVQKTILKNSTVPSSSRWVMRPLMWSKSRWRCSVLKYNSVHGNIRQSREWPAAEHPERLREWEDTEENQGSV